MTERATRATLTGALVIAVVLGLGWVATRDQGRVAGPAAPGILRPLPTREPLVPTPLPPYRPTVTPQASPQPGASQDPEAQPAQRPAEGPAAAGSPAATAVATSDADDGAPTEDPEPWRRVGVGVPIGGIGAYEWKQGLPGWYVNWLLRPALPEAKEARFVHMIYVNGDRIPALQVIQLTAQGDPGALWLVGNEPDVAWQGNSTPEQYARAYHMVYSALKAADPGAQVAIGGVSQPTPLRITYLERILAAYRSSYGEEMPIDVWNVHAFILREERDSWGVGIPPGLDGPGQLYEISDHTDLSVFRRQIADFRRWMEERGYRNKPLIVSEYGVLMPESYGFSQDVVSQFLVDTFDFFLTARDPETGYAADDNRLVQAFCWYSAADTTYPTSNLFDPETGSITPTGAIFRAYVSGLR